MIYNQWTQLMTKHPLLFQTREVQWMGTLEQLQQYIDAKNSLPPNNSKDPTEKQLATWVGTQKANYKKQTNIMKERC